MGLNITRTATVSYTADQWQLFSEPGRDEAAVELNQALQAAVNTPGATESTVYAAMRPVCEKFGHLGASDSEADDLIERVCEKVLG